MRNESTLKSTRETFMKTDHESSEMIGLCHVGMNARNPALLAEFYRDVMGMQIVGGSDETHPLGPSAFLSRPGEESHETAIFGHPEFAHRAFKVRSMAALKRFYKKIVARGIPIKFQFHHGVSVAFYFPDPEGNLIEVNWPTGAEHRQPCAQEIDLTKPEEELLDKAQTLRPGTGAKGSSKILRKESENTLLRKCEQVINQ
jgi:catechol 2,3-dioxygenase